MYSDGSLSVMSLMRLRAHDKRHDPRSEDWHWSEILRATAWRASGWLDVDGTMAPSGHAGYRALAGESASHGSVGWVALTLHGRAAHAAVAGGGLLVQPVRRSHP